jgi:hypothetical protein
VGQILYMSIMFTFLAVFLLGLYGLSTGGVDLFTTMNQISGGWPTVSTAKCSFSASGPTGNCNILDTATLGVVWAFTVVGSVLFRIGAVFYLGYQVFTVLNGFRSFPYLGWFFGSLMLIITVEFWKLFRSGHTS